MEAMSGGRAGVPRGVRQVCVGALGVLLLAACQDGVGPEPREMDGLSADEVALDEAAGAVEALDREMAAEVAHAAESDRLDARPDRPHDRARHTDLDRVRLAVELSGTAVALAERILEDAGAGPAQLRLLKAAGHFHRAAVAALATGHRARALALARKACWTALKAVVLPGGVTEEEARRMHELAATLLEEARAAVATDGSRVEEVLVRWAGRLFEKGSAQLERGHVRGVAALWKSAVISAWIIR